MKTLHGKFVIKNIGWKLFRTLGGAGYHVAYYATNCTLNTRTAPGAPQFVAMLVCRLRCSRLERISNAGDSAVSGRRHSQ